MSPRCPFDSSSRTLLRAVLQSNHPTSANSILPIFLPAWLPARPCAKTRTSYYLQSSSSRLLSSTPGTYIQNIRPIEKSARPTKDAIKRKPNASTPAIQKPKGKQTKHKDDTGPPRKGNFTQGKPKTAIKGSSYKDEPWYQYKLALKEKFPEGWNPRKKISPDAMEGMRALHAQYPDECNREVLANMFKISQEAVRRILKAKPKHEAMQAQQRERWAKRHDQIWDTMSEIGLRPKRHTRRSPDEKTFEMPDLPRSA